MKRYEVRFKQVVTSTFFVEAVNETMASAIAGALFDQEVEADDTDYSDAEMDYPAEIV